jgi:hypothetical protein
MTYRAKTSMDEDLQKLEKAHEILSGANERLKNLVSRIQGNQYDWEGKNKDAALCLLSLCSQFSNRLIPISEKNLDSMKEFYNNADYFMSNSAVLQKWR